MLKMHKSQSQNNYDGLRKDGEDVTHNILEPPLKASQQRGSEAPKQPDEGQTAACGCGDIEGSGLMTP